MPRGSLWKRICNMTDCKALVNDGEGYAQFILELYVFASVALNLIRSPWVESKHQTPAPRNEVKLKFYKENLWSHICSGLLNLSFTSLLLSKL